MFERFAREARMAVVDAGFVAAAQGERRISTEHLLTALLADDALVQLVGIDAQTVRRKSAALDQAALSAVGVEISGIELPELSGDEKRASQISLGVKAVLKDSLANALAMKSKEISGVHLMLAILSRNEPDPAAVVLNALEVDRDVVREKLRKAA